jgi:hypothetical protein
MAVASKIEINRVPVVGFMVFPPSAGCGVVIRVFYELDSEEEFAL